jgi:hypothetical protein
MDAPDWTYEYSAALGMKYAYRDTPEGMEVMTEDRTRYSPREVALLQQAGGITAAVHRVKKVFEGRIVAFNPSPSPAASPGSARAPASPSPT